MSQGKELLLGKKCFLEQKEIFLHHIFYRKADNRLNVCLSELA
jgi:hypothetical protein